MKLKKAILLAGGLGKRLGSAGRAIPKILISIHGRSLLDRHLEQFKQLGIEEVDLVASYKYRAQLRKFLKNISQGVKLKLVLEKASKGPTKALVDQGRRLKRPILIVLGDIYYLRGLGRFLPEVTQEHPVVLGISKKSKEKISRECNVCVNAAQGITSLLEKPGYKQIKGSWCWSGWVALHPSFFTKIKKSRAHIRRLQNMELGNFFEAWRQEGIRLRAKKDPGGFINLNRLSDVRMARRFARGRTQ